MLQRGASPATADAGLESSLRRRWRLGEKFIESWIFLNGLLAIVVLLGIVVLLLREGLPVFTYTLPWKFFFGTKWYPVSEPPTFGIMPFFMATIWVTLVATAISIPVGVGCAAYLAEVAPVKVRETVKPIIEILAGIPSVVIGFIGLMLLSPLVRSMFNLNTGLSGLTAGIMLSLMSLPIIVSVSEDALRAVPDDFRQAAFALGSTKWEIIRHVSIPAALSGMEIPMPSSTRDWAMSLMKSSPWLSSRLLTMLESCPVWRRLWTAAILLPDPFCTIPMENRPVLSKLSLVIVYQMRGNRR